MGEKKTERKRQRCRERGEEKEERQGEIESCLLREMAERRRAEVGRDCLLKGQGAVCHAQRRGTGCDTLCQTPKGQGQGVPGS